MTAPRVDEKLLYRVEAGDQGAFRVLVDQSDRLVTALLIDRIGNRAEVEDLRQEVFFRVYRNLERLRDKRKFNSWLRGICRNVVREFWAAKARNHGPLDDAPEPEATVEVDDEQRSIELAINQALETLPSRYREILRLRYFAKMDYEAISATVGLSFMAVDALIRRAKTRLREQVTPILEREDLR
ncbi:MAG: sigma-70 family RNA polymerase sigma factor [Planctomycetes bacterium]|nr:sigma-70 family RNA polymerase sigma factor [Planctomycetota bacterium]